MNNSAKRTLKYLSLAVFGMFFFSFALVPLYDVFCEVTGLNGKISQSEEGTSWFPPLIVKSFHLNLLLHKKHRTEERAQMKKRTSQKLQVTDI